MSSNIFFFENRAVYEIMWKNTVQPDRPQVTVWRKRTACCTTTAINTHSTYVILNCFPLQQWYNERASILRYTYIVCRVLSYQEEANMRKRQRL